MNLDQKLKKLREQWKTATKSERKLLEMQAQILKWGKDAPKDDNNKPEPTSGTLTYKTKSPYVKDGKTYVTAPLKYFDSYRFINIEYNGRFEKFLRKDVAFEMPQEDKFSENKIYKLAYFLWNKK